MASLVAAAEGLVARLQEQPWVALAATLIIACITVRLMSGHNEGHQPNSQILDAKTPPAVPYWIPYLGHLPRFAFNSESLLVGLRNLYPDGAFSLTFLGTTHTMVYRPGLTAALVNQPAHMIDGGPASKHLLKSNFGYPRSKSSLALYDKVLPGLKDQYAHLLSEKSLGWMVDRTMERLRHNIADFVTFNSGDIDQTHWERIAEAGLVEDPTVAGVPVIEANMFELVRNFVAFTANGSLLGTDFVENYPEFWQALWRFDAGFLPLAVDLPSLVPIGKAIGARRARSALFRCLDEFERALETHRDGGNPGPQWADLDNVGPVIQGRLDEVYRKHGLSIPQRSALDLSLVWAMNANASPFVFWVLWRVYSDPELLAQVRDEIAPFVVLEAPVIGFGAAVGIDTPSRIERLDLDGLMNKCPRLKASYVESLRLDFSSWSFKAVREDTVLGARDGEKVLLRAGTYAHGAYELHHTDPSAYEDPLTWRHERHIKWEVNEKGEKRPVANLGDIRPYGESPVPPPRHLTCGENLYMVLGLTSESGGGAHMCKGRQYAVREILLFSAAIIAVYDIQPVGGGEWKMPKSRRTTGTKQPVQETRVWIKTRPSTRKPT